jgi:uncharacterized protein YprB with RNaseH-like and TPR domain
MRFKQLTEMDREVIKNMYKGTKSKAEVQKELSGMYDVSERTIRNWANRLNLNTMQSASIPDSKVMVYDIETSRSKAWVWGAGKQFISYNQLIDEPRVITVAWKWLGSDTVHHLTWDENHSDEQLIRNFLKEYNKADMIIGYNNNNFDNRWINARAMKYNLDVNTLVKSFDIMKEEKRVFRVPSYSMAFMAKYANVTHKQGHEGIHMWEMIQTGTPDEQAEYLQKMVDYNVGDIVATEELYFRLRKYFQAQVHFGVLSGGEKYSCPECGGTNIELVRRTVTKAGTIQYIMRCKDDGVQFKINNRTYLKFIEENE